jgi:hypothetical protein
LRNRSDQEKGNKELENIISRINKISLKAIGYLAEVYLEKDYEKARLAIEY